MELYGWMHLVFGICGLIAIAFGGWLLRMARLQWPRLREGWRRPTDAGSWYICLGVFLVLLAASYFGRDRDALGTGGRWVLIGVAFALATVATVKFRPRMPRREPEN